MSDEADWKDSEHHTKRLCQVDTRFTDKLAARSSEHLSLLRAPHPLHHVTLPTGVDNVRRPVIYDIAVVLKSQLVL